MAWMVAQIYFLLHFFCMFHGQSGLSDVCVDVNLTKQTFLFTLEELFSSNIGKNRISRNIFREAKRWRAQLDRLPKHTQEF